jgi:hypothetical protein
VKNHASQKSALLNFAQSRYKSRSSKLPRSAPGGELRSPVPGFAGVMPRSGMPGAFCHGMVKNQQGLATEVLKIGSG